MAGRQHKPDTLGFKDMLKPRRERSVVVMNDKSHRHLCIGLAFNRDCIVLE